MQRKICNRITGWSLAVLAAFGLFSYLTFIPNSAFAEEDQRTLMNIKYMQQMTDKICENTAENKSKQLIDKRGTEPYKTYWVTKLRDGNCWMTQNLDYDPPSDIIKIPTTDTASLGEWITNQKVTDTTAAYYDPGTYYYKSIGLANGCTSVDGPSGCTANVFSTTGTDRHYLIGNYYSWPAATYGSTNNSASNTSGDANASICPTGWRLPTSGTGGKLSTNSTEGSGSFEYLLRHYNWSGNTSIEPSTIGSNGIYGAPLYLFYGGYLSGGRLYNAGSTGYYWSSTINSGALAYQLTIGANNVNPSSNSANGRHTGMFVRCLVRTTTKNDQGNGNKNEQLWPDPLYPDDPDFPDEIPVDIPPAHGTANISVTVSPVISLDVATSSTSDKMTAEFTKVSTSEIITNVSSNYQYTVSISTEQTTLEQDPKTEYNIPMIGTGTNGNGKNDVEKSVSGWGIKKKLSATNPEELGSTKDEDKYSPVGIGSAHPEVFYKSNGAEALTNDKALIFEVGVGVDAKLPSGRYSTTVTLTAGVI